MGPSINQDNIQKDIFTVDVWADIFDVQSVPALETTECTCSRLEVLSAGLLAT